MAAGQGLTPILLRSSTPGHNEKVLNFLQGIDELGNEAHYSPPQSIADNEEYKSQHSQRTPMSPSRAARSPPPNIHSPAPKSKQSDAVLAELANSSVSYENRQRENGDDMDDNDSNVQQGERSEGEDDETALPVREPMPSDPPGPHYESYDTVPSFGNKGPLPNDDEIPTADPNPFAHPTWNPNWTAFNKNQVASPPWEPNVGLTPGGQAADIALPPSRGASRVASPTSVNIGVQSPSHSTRSNRNRGSQDGAAFPPDSVRPKSRTSKGPLSHKAGSDFDAPMSPRSAKSKLTNKTRGTEYPPLPESVRGEEMTGLPSPISSNSPKPPARSRAAPSVSPSESLSQPRGPPKADSRMGGYQNPRSVAAPYSPPPSSVLSGQGRPGAKLMKNYAPYRNAPTQEDLLSAAVRGRGIVIPEGQQIGLENGFSEAGDYGGYPIVPPTPPRERSQKGSSVVSNTGRTPAIRSPPRSHKPASSIASKVSNSPSKRSAKDRVAEPEMGPSRAMSPVSLVLDQEEQQMVDAALASSRTPRTSFYAGSVLEADVANSHFHDMDLCVLLHQLNDPSVHEIVKRALRKAVRQRVKKLGMKYDNESIKQYQREHHNHDPTVHLNMALEEPPKWATDIKRELVLVQQRIESLGETLGPKIETLLPNQPIRSIQEDPREEYGGSRTPTQTVNIHTQPTGTLADSMYHPIETDVIVEDDQNEFYNMAEGTSAAPRSEYDGPVRHLRERTDRDDSPGQQYLEEELYKLRQKPHGSQSGLSHRTWEVARENHGDDDDDFADDDIVEDDEPGADEAREPSASGLPTIPDTGYNTDHRTTSPPLPPLPDEQDGVLVHNPNNWAGGDEQLPPWQKIHQRLLSWAIIWPLSEFDNALNSTTRGHQVNEVALSVWSTQTYKRYVRARLTDSPQGVVDRLFVPPNMADAISNAVFNGRHGDACGMLRDLWSPFGLPGMPRLLVVLAKHRSDENHWVVHRFSLPDGSLTTYDSYPERTLPDGRPLGWWFAIRVAWPNAIYPSPDHLMQKMVRLHRPMQLGIDNSVAAAGIWRNILMGSRAERSLDLERLRDLINTEVKNLRQRKQLGKLSIGAPQPTWEEMT